MSSFTNNGANVLAAKDANVHMAAPAGASATGPASSDGQKDMEYHRQVLKSKMEAQQYVITKAPPSPAADAAKKKKKTSVLLTWGVSLVRIYRSGNNYISPSDEIMSPCTAKLNALRNKQVGKYVPHLL